MSGGSSTPLEPGINYGIPARTSASVALWAHLLRKDTLPSIPDPGIILPPVTPLDKNGTSMKILLHDTQAHIDKFSAKVDGLCKSVDTTKQEISMVHTLFQHEHETLTTEIVDLVNRSQTQLQATIGSPAQAEEVGRFSKDLSTQLELLDKRIDAIQLFNQTHAQTLQLQSQVLQSLQEQQGNVVTAIMPLLPLLQALPLHIESARNIVTDKISKTFEFSAQSRSPATLHSNVRKRACKRFNSSLMPDPSPSLPSKRARLIADVEPSGCLASPNEYSTNGGRFKAPLFNISPITDNSSNGISAPPSAIPVFSSLSKLETTVDSDVDSVRAADTEEFLDNSRPLRSPTSRPQTRKATPLTSADHPAGRCGSDGKNLLAAFPITHNHDQSCQPVELTPQIGNNNDNVIHLTAKRHYVAPSQVQTPSTIPAVLSIPLPGPNTSHLFPCAYVKNLSPAPETPQKQSPKPLVRDTTTVSPHRVNSVRPLVSDLAKENVPQPKIRQESSYSSRTRKEGLSKRPLIFGNMNPTRQSIKLISQPREPRENSSQRAVLSQRPMGTAHPLSEMALTMKTRGRRSPFRAGRRFIPLSDSDDDNDDREDQTT